MTIFQSANNPNIFYFLKYFRFLILCLTRLTNLPNFPITHLVPPFGLVFLQKRLKVRQVELLREESAVCQNIVECSKWKLMILFVAVLWKQHFSNLVIAAAAGAGRQRFVWNIVYPMLAPPHQHHQLLLTGLTFLLNSTTQWSKICQTTLMLTDTESASLACPPTPAEVW